VQTPPPSPETQPLPAPVAPRSAVRVVRGGRTLSPAGRHALRLGVQGVELLTTGRITLPVPEPSRSHLLAVRRGDVPLPEVLAAVTDAEQRLRALRDSASVPPQPDRAWVDGWLHRSYLAYWERLAAGTA
jgi:hypothetical protein